MDNKASDFRCESKSTYWNLKGSAIYAPMRALRLGGNLSRRWLLETLGLELMAFSPVLPSIRGFGPK